MPGPPNYTLRRFGFVAASVAVVVLVWAGVGMIFGGTDDDNDADQPSTGSSSTEPANETGSTSTELVAAPACSQGDLVTELAGLDDWTRTIIDTERRLPEGYEPEDLTSVTRAGFDEKFEEYQVREFVIADLAALRQAAEDARTPLAVISAYRSDTFQQELFDERISQIGEEAAAAQLARPGHSEHQLGTTLDFGVPGTGTIFSSEGTDAQARFVAEHAHEFGFVISYPDGAMERACYIYEPWHVRYFGRDLAQRIHDSGLVARDYLWHWYKTGEEPQAAR